MIPGPKSCVTVRMLTQEELDAPYVEPPRRVIDLSTVTWGSFKGVVYPHTYVKLWFCPECKREHVAHFYISEEGDGDFDGFDFHCECGAYFKKAGRIPDECVIKTGWAKGNL